MKTFGRVRDILIPIAEYPHIRRDSALRDAFVAMQRGLTTEKRFRHVLVLDEAGRLIGILGLRDILRGVFPDYLRATLPGQIRAEVVLPEYPALASFWEETFHTQCREEADKPAAPYVVPVKARVAPDDPVTKAAYLMVFTDTNMLPVVEGDIVLGVIRLVDIFTRATEVVLHG